MILRLIIALTSGLLMGLTTAPVNAWPLAWVALAPLWILIIQNEKLEIKNEKISSLFLIGLAWGIGYHGLALSWITGIHPMTWMGVPWVASLLIAFCCWIFITLWGAAIVAIWAIFLASLDNFNSKLRHDKSRLYNSKLKTLIRLLMGTALWCSLEALWSYSSLYWSSLSYTQSPYNLAILHLGQISGPLTVTAAIVAVNGLIAEAVTGFIAKEQNSIEKPQSTLAIAASLLISLHLLGLALYSRSQVQNPEAALKIGIVQGNIPNELKLYPEGWRRAIEGYTTGYQSLSDRGVDAVLTPETALPFLWTDPNQIQGSFYPAVLQKGVVAWVGALGEKGRSLTNSLFTVTGTGEIFSRYDKVKLVPLGEFIPFEEFIGQFINRLSPLDAHLAAGSANQLFDTPFGRAIVSICYESAFSAHFRRQTAAGGQFILSPSNDAHYSAAMPAQHHAQDVIRAIETDRWTVRATNTGYSAIVDPHGRTKWISKLNTYELHADTIYRRQTKTLYVRWGNWLTPLLLLLAASLSIYLGISHE